MGKRRGKVGPCACAGYPRSNEIQVWPAPLKRLLRGVHRWVEVALLHGRIGEIVPQGELSLEEDKNENCKYDQFQRYSDIGLIPRLTYIN